jgi:hypothetical protein
LPRIAEVPSLAHHSLDRAGLFLHPVARSEVPDYYDIVTSPMTWSGMAEKLEAQQYGDAAAFRADIELVLRNAMLYNKPDTAFHRSAQRILKGCAGVFETLEALEKVHGPDQAGQEQLGLEPEEAILRLLCDYEEQTQDLSDSNDAEAAPKSAIEDLVRHFYSVEAPAAPAPAARAPTPPPRVKLSLQRSSRSARTDEGSTAPAQASSAQSPAPTRRGRSGAAPAEDAAVEELERAPRSEQDKAAARLARAKTEEEKEETRRRKQRSALAASQASAAARQRRKREAEEAAAARSAKKQRASASPQLHGGSKRDAAAAAPDASSQASVRRGRSAHRAESESSSSSAEATSTTPEAERALRQRRSGAAPEPRELEVQQVDSWDSFKRFNVGWVLPEGSSRRGNRAAAAPSAASSAHDAQSARKRSASATTAPRSGERAASSELSEEDAAAPAAGSSSSSSNAPPSHRTASAATASATTAAAAPVRIRKRGSHGQFISKHDDPSKPRAPRGEPGKSPAAVRRARPSGGSEARSNEASSSNRRSLKPSLLSSPLTSDDEDESSSARRTFVLGASDDEELTEPDTPLLHGHGDDEEAPPDAAERAAQGRARRNAQRREKHRLKRMAERRALQEQKERGRAKRRAREEEEDGSGAAKRRKSEVQLDDDDEYAPATLVWAKVSGESSKCVGRRPEGADACVMLRSGHPFFPAEVIDAQADDVPDDVRASARLASRLLHHPADGPLCAAAHRCWRCASSTSRPPRLRRRCGWCASLTARRATPGCRRRRCACCLRMRRSTARCCAALAIAVRCMARATPPPPLVRRASWLTTDLIRSKSSTRLGACGVCTGKDDAGCLRAGVKHIRPANMALARRSSPSTSTSSATRPHASRSSPLSSCTHSLDTMLSRCFVCDLLHPLAGAVEVRVPRARPRGCTAPRL